MKDIFPKRSQKEFIEIVDQFVQSFREKFPNCDKTQDMETYFNGIVKGNDALEREMINKWVENMGVLLQRKKVQYAKAVQRITGEPATCYHACVYHDADGFGCSTQSKLLQDMEVLTKYKDECMTEEDRTIFWKYIEKLNVAAYDATSTVVPRVPTREEIRENIESRSQKNENDQHSVGKAFITSMSKLFDKHKSEETKNYDETSSEDWMNKWSEIGKREINGQKISSLVTSKDKLAEDALKQEFHLNDFDNEDWEIVQNLYSYATVGNAIPSRMMTRIEDLAGKLAEDIVSGKKDMSTVDLNDIGQQVLSGCAPEDMQKFAGNLDELLPVITKFAAESSGK